MDELASRRRKRRRDEWSRAFEIRIVVARPRDAIGYLWAIMVSLMPVGLVVIALYATKPLTRTKTPGDGGPRGAA